MRTGAPVVVLGENAPPLSIVNDWRRCRYAPCTVLLSRRRRPVELFRFVLRIGDVVIVIAPPTCRIFNLDGIVRGHDRSGARK